MDPEKPPSLRSLFTRMVGTFVALLLVIYPLSIGPTVYYVEKHYHMGSSPKMGKSPMSKSKGIAMLNKIYAPLRFAVAHVPPVEPVFEAYIKFWHNLAKNDA